MTIVKKDGGYEVQSETGKNLGTSTSLKGAKKRLAQVEYFKHIKEARMSAAVKLQRAFQRQQEKSEASRRRGEELLKQARESQEKKQQTNEGTIQPNGTDKIDLGVADVATKKKTDKEMKDQQNESWTFDTAAMAKQELADAKNKQHRKRGKVANLLRKLGMKEEVEQIDELSKSTLGSYVKNAARDVGASRSLAKDFERDAKSAKKPITKDVSTRLSNKFANIASKRHAGIGKAVERLTREEVSLDEGLDPSEVAGNPKMYSADDVKKAYYHKKASAGDKESLERHLDRHHGNKEWRKPVKEESENEMNEGVLDKVKSAGKKALETLGHGSDEQLRKDLQKKVGVPQTGEKPKKLREFIEGLKEGKAKDVNVDKVHAAGDKPHEEKWEDAKKVKKESFTAQDLLQALKEGLWPGTPEHTAKFGDKYKQQQGGGAGIKKGTRYGGSAQKPEKEEDHDADDKPAKKNK